jgi:ADP-ribosyl-[dinitrogen reductase] hydrolase
MTDKRMALARQLWFWQARAICGSEHAKTFAEQTTYTENDWNELLIDSEQRQWLERADQVLRSLSNRTPAVLVGLAIGDALGAHFETLDGAVHPELASWDGSYRACTRLGLPAGHTTDDTEMAECLAASLVACREFDGNDVARRYLVWAQGTPHGMGGTTRKAMARLAEGISWRQSGITFGSPHEVGSAPAMRVAPIGAAFADSTVHSAKTAIRTFVACDLDARITHADPEACASSLAVAFTVRNMLRLPLMLSPGEGIARAIADVVAGIADNIASEYLPTLVDSALRRIPDALRKGRSPQAFAASHAGSRGNAWQITATAIYCALWAQSYQDGVVAAVQIGGDTDTRAAIAGAILGARFGLEGIPNEYKTGLLDFQRLHALDLALSNVQHVLRGPEAATTVSYEDTRR